ncbi:MAG: 6-phosphogluconolactonase [Bryobacteraceae bacterium]
MGDRELYTLAGTNELFRRGAEEFVRSAKDAIEDRGICNVALSGGSTPKGLFSLLVSDESLRAQVQWKKINFFWSDERHVPPDHPDSNFRMANEALLSKLSSIDSKRVFRIKGELENAEEAAEEYERELIEHFRLEETHLPRFDLALLGMGPDGHTASLFPGTRALHDQEHLVACNWVGKFDTDRITMTARVLNNAASVVFLVAGEDKAPALKSVLQGPFEPDQLPAQLIRPVDGRLIWLVDEAAGRLLKS